VPRDARARSGAVERSNSPRKIGVGHARSPVSRAVRTSEPPLAGDRERELRARARIAERILRQVLDHDPEHARPASAARARGRRPCGSRRRRGSRASSSAAATSFEHPRARAPARARPPRAPSRARSGNSTSSISSRIWSTCPVACSITARGSSPGSSAVSSRRHQPR
jgi:hypothetical protein